MTDRMQGHEEEPEKFAGDPVEDLWTEEEVKHYGKLDSRAELDQPPGGVQQAGA